MVQDENNPMEIDETNDRQILPEKSEAEVNDKNEDDFIEEKFQERASSKYLKQVLFYLDMIL